MREDFNRFSIPRLSDPSLNRYRINRSDKEQKGNMRAKTLFSFLILLIVGGVLLIKLWPHAANLTHAVTSLVFRKPDILKQTNGRTNILILGIGGGNHDGPNLTDTIIFASIDQKMHKVTLVSIPRDLWLPDLQSKINGAYQAGIDKDPKTALKYTEGVLSSVVGQPMHYGVRIDFGGFVKAVDELGGLDINVDRTFDDYTYPISGKEDDTCGHTDKEITDLTAQIATGSATEGDSFPCRYKHIHFVQGLAHMDGETALEYVRSRHALGSEGTDFARSRRQEKVISAIKQKLFSSDTFLHPSRILNLIGILKDSIDTDIGNAEIVAFVEQAGAYKSSPIKSTVIDQGDDITGRLGLLTNPPIGPEFGGAWVLIPRTGDGDFSEIHSFVSCELKYPQCFVTDTQGKIATQEAKLK